ncbi:MAG: Fe-S cluster assembly protein HesB, partial [Clostridia bacterium]|nr:Fe-S cluster assembly protein HesB [Clostridia bacterium]
MNRKELADAIHSFDIKTYNKRIKPYEDIRKKFVKQFSVRNIPEMSLDEYIIGKQSKTSFCYILEHTLAPLGNMIGANASKFGIYYSSKTGQYEVSKIWTAKNVQESFWVLKKELIQLIEAGEREDFDIIRTTRISPMFKGKILSTYFPEKYLGVFSGTHLDYFIHFLELDHMIGGCRDIFDKRNALLNFKNNDSTMATWSLHAFVNFLYEKYPCAPKKGEEI